jgi:hypothetical protein
MITAFLVTAVLMLGLLATPAEAQKGMGERSGVAREALTPPTLSMVGTVTEIRIGPCEHTTGPSQEGVHLIVKVPDGSAINLHLGPKSALSDDLKHLSVGQAVDIEAFRTDLMPQDAYVATSIQTGIATIDLRDANLRPSWASGKGRDGRPSGPRGAGRSQGRGP